MPLTRSVPLRWRLTLLAATVVAVAVALMAMAAYAVVSRALYGDVDSSLRQVSRVVIETRPSDLGPQDLANAVMYQQDVAVAVLYPDGNSDVPLGLTIPIGEPELAVARGEQPESLRTVDGTRVLAVRADVGWTLVAAMDLGVTKQVLDRLAIVLFAAGGFGVVLAAIAGTAVGRTGLQPVGRLTAAAERVARADDLTPIPVTGDDEFARLTSSFNSMLETLALVRQQQARLVADAGHELRTPLTSLRTNIELLIAAGRAGAAKIPEADMQELRADVVGQIGELTTLVDDLMDLAEDDAPGVSFERVDLAEVVQASLVRARRRRADIAFDVQPRPWVIYGDMNALVRAVVNVLDNAAKWSPSGALVEVRMRQIADGLLELTVADSGPGIPAEERELVFDRFYRMTASRAMPGSGLGLAIVRQVITNHGGTIEIGESVMGGTLIRIVMPGENVPDFQ